MVRIRNDLALLYVILVVEVPLIRLNHENGINVTYKRGESIEVSVLFHYMPTYKQVSGLFVDQKNDQQQHLK